MPAPDRYPPHASTQLSPRELCVLQAVADGATNKEIAAALYVSPKTVEYHLGKVFMKLAVTNRTQAARRLAHLEPTGQVPALIGNPAARPLTAG